MFLEVLFYAFSLILTLVFFLYGFNHYFLLNASRKYKIPPLPARSPILPTVSIQLPVYNERYVIRRLVSACAAMAEAYQIDKVKILVLDDSDDDTLLEVDKIVEEFRKKSFDIEVQRREDRSGFKAGALQAALRKTGEEYIAIFDADFIPPADFLLRTIPYFEQDERLGIVQSRWTHLNRDFNLLTKALSLGIDVHFFIEQTGRYASGCFQNFNGSGGVLRTKAVLEAGGWCADTLAEDLDLSYQMQRFGYRILYLRDLECPGEIPPTIPSFKLQQGRWACGSLRNARKILPTLLQDRKIGIKERTQAFIHLTGYMIHPLMVISFVLSCLTVLLDVQNLPAAPGTGLIHSLQTLSWVVMLPLLILCTLAPWISLGSTLRLQNLPLLRNLSTLLAIILLSLGISLSNMREAGKALFSNRNWEFKRTPKYADLNNRQEWRSRRYQISIDPLWMAELLFTLVGMVSIGMAIHVSNYSVLMILVPFTISYAIVLWLTLQQSRKSNA
jgi:cellulose synthase/poly-beta-1,6-N-acetylglucosamine synthase-like glycosyltransferase